MPALNLNGSAVAFSAGERPLDVVNRSAVKVPQVCYHHQLGPIQTCDTCMVEVDGKLVRACGNDGDDGMNVVTESAKGSLPNARLSTASSAIICSIARYATTTTATARCTTPRAAAGWSIRTIPFQPSPTKWTCQSLYRYDPDQCILCGRCVQACQSPGERNATIGWEDPPPRVWDGARRLVNRVASPADTVSPCVRAMR